MKVKCIKNIRNFKSGNYYYVFIEFKDSYWINDNDDVQKFYKDNNHINDVKFSDYFSDVQYIRKMKIEKLNRL